MLRRRSVRTLLGGLCLCLLALAWAGAPPAAAQGEEFDARLGRAVDAVAQVVAEGDQSGVQASPGSLNALRVSLAELLEAGSAAGKSRAAIERALMFRILKRVGRDLPDWLADDRGLPNVAGLLGAEPRRAGASEADYLSSIRAEGQETVVGNAETEPAAAEPAETAQAATPAAEEPAAEPRYVVVRQGDTLSGLAEEHYGSVLEFRRIYVANRDKISNPSLLYPGTRLVLP